MWSLDCKEIKPIFAKHNNSEAELNLTSENSVLVTMVHLLQNRQLESSGVFNPLKLRAVVSCK